MFFKKRKGTYGYLKKAPVFQGLLTILLLILPAGLFLIGYSITKDVKNLFTIAAVVGMLPAAKSIVSFIMYLRSEKYTCPGSLYKEISPLAGDNMLIGYDYFLTSYSVNYPIPAACVAKKCLIGYMSNPKLKSTDTENHIKEYCTKNEIKGITVKIFDSEDKFVERAKSLSGSEEELSEDEMKAFELLSSLCL